MLSIEKKENRIYKVYKFYYKFFTNKEIFSIYYDKVYKKTYIISNTKEFLQSMLNINDFKELDEVSRFLEAKIRDIVKKHFKRNNCEINEIEKKITFIIKELEDFLKDFLLLQSI